MEKFDSIYARAAERKGGEQGLESMVSKPLTRDEVAAIPEDRWLSAFSMKVFQSGISWKVVRNKWPNFEEHFFQFRIDIVDAFRRTMGAESARSKNYSPYDQGDVDSSQRCDDPTCAI
ncbi:DNA-3-methyladenine glycosylase [Vibrio variabilis]|uniref:DNA-3-methyladenine glycosylase n=1 Tax=Vibrio variabilis TaxID=990271 RepID=A0ABQ0JAG7_9VIBR|nr:DNA-3-methyladenine glycosylase [Vibrio variabilis]